MTSNNSIQLLTIGCHHILHIGNILQASLYLKRDSTCLNEFFQVGRLVQVFQRQQMTLVLQLTTIGIEQIELHATDLCTGATIGRTAKAMLRGIAQTTIADTQGAMNKDLQLYIGYLTVNGCNLFDRQLTSQYHTTEA